MDAGKPQIKMNQTFGDGDTSFVIEGFDWRAGRRVTITLAGVGRSPLHPTIDKAGTFSYAINQGHEFFVGKLPPGTYRVVVTAARHARAVATFVVNHL